MWASRALARLGAPAAALLLLLATTLQIQVSSGSSIVKRSLSALARTSQLPHSSSSEPGGHEQDHGGHPHTPGEPHKRSELQEEALREELLRQRAAPATEALLSAILEADPFENGVEDKRSLSSLARYGNLPVAVDDKRSLASLAREGNYPISLDDKRSLAALAREGNLPLQDDKRSLSSLARYGNLPLPAAAKRSLEALARGGLLNKNTRVDANKRSLSALARAGELPKRWRPPHQREQSEDLLDHLQRELEQTKRGLSSLARGASLPRAAAFEDALSLPISMEEQQGKRSLQSLARAWSLPEPKRSPPYGAFDDVEWVKRNAAALLRQSKLTGGDAADDGTRRNDLESERQGQGRRKRSLWDSEAGEVVSPYVQSSSSGQDPDWDGLPLWSPTAWGAYFGLGEDAVPQPAQQKRFLGSVARSWSASSWRGPAAGSASSAPSEDAVSKRHIGALARSGLLPAFRSLRYARSGRAVQEDVVEGLQGVQGRPPFRMSRASGPMAGLGRGAAGAPRYRRVCYYREDPEYGPTSTKD